VEASITLSLTLSETEAPSVKARETAERETPAISATSFKVTAIPFDILHSVFWFVYLIITS
jgi:hypothetical protein